MKNENSNTAYSKPTKILHWLISMLVISVWICGIYMSELPNTSTYKGSVYGLHKNIGMLILILLCIRIAWRIYEIYLLKHSKQANIFAKIVHFLLYVALLIQPLTGWLMSSAANRLPRFFGLFTFPSLIQQNMVQAKFFNMIHNKFAWILLVLICMHVFAAFYHQLILKDRTINKML